MLTIDRLLEVAEYEPSSGKFFWLERPRDAFTKDGAHASWNARCAGKEAGCIRSDGFRKIVIDNVSYLAHILVWFIETGEWPAHPIEHKNCLHSDNRFDNLRLSSLDLLSRKSQISIRNKSGSTGIYRRGPAKWTAQIWDGNRHVYLGTFTTKPSAIKARKDAERRLGYHDLHGRTFPTRVNT